jgi:uncharacterized membrane protein
MILLYLTTLATLILADGAMLVLYLAPAFQAQFGAALAASPLILPAALFYLGYPAILVALVSNPALRQGRSALIPAALMGLAAYGTHELTNWSTLAGYPAGLAIFDTVWGTVLTALAAVTGLAITRRLRHI